MIDLKNFNLIDFQTEYMKNDITTRALCEVLTPLLIKIASESELAFFYGRIDELGHKLLDELAWQFKIDFYSVDFPLNVKRNLVKNARKIHKTRGTPAAVETLLTSIFGNATLHEWFEYGGDPFYFKVKIFLENDINMLITEFEKALVDVKNCRSHLEKIEIYSVSKNECYFGCLVVGGEEIKVFPWMPKEIESRGDIYVAAGQKTSLDDTSIYPKKR